jgi:hypothetical protein
MGAGSELMIEPGEKTQTTDDLGTRMIAGVEFAGFRITTTLIGQPARVAFDEHWISAELGLLGANLTSSPRKKTSMTIPNRDREWAASSSAPG